MTTLRAAKPLTDYQVNPLVLRNRPIRPGVPAAQLSHFTDDYWDLTSGVFEEHAHKIGINFAVFTPKWRHAVKVYYWHLINDEEPRALAYTHAARPALQTLTTLKPHLLRLLDWADQRGLEGLHELNQKHLDDFLAYVVASRLSYHQQTILLSAVRRLWLYRDVMEPELRLPAAEPWTGDNPRDLLGPRTPSAENKTPRIPDATLLPLLAWAFRFVEDLADDVVASFDEFRTLLASQSEYSLPSHSRVPDGTIDRKLGELLPRLAGAGIGIPSVKHPDGSATINWQHLSRLIHSPGIVSTDVRRQLLEASGLSLDDARLLTRCTARFEGISWRVKPLLFHEAPRMATNLLTAGFIIISYLSGMRPGETLGLQRDCLNFDNHTGLWTVSGRHWKKVTTQTGEKDIQGELRPRPWVVHPVVAQTIKTILRLHSSPHLFPKSIRPDRLRAKPQTQRQRPGTAKSSTEACLDIANFIDWVNTYCAESGSTEKIPLDDGMRITGTRFRRTLAWHIVRRPRGLVAAAIQYGHVDTYMTQGYAGKYDSGFPDELAFERWLERVDDAAAMQIYLSDHGTVSGPAAAELAHRTLQANTKFAGRVLPTNRQATKLLEDPSLQVYAGRGMHCVFNRATALCATDDGVPDIDGCRSACPNIARTDADIAVLTDDLKSLPEDPLSPSVRYERIREIKTKLATFIDNHQEDVK